MAESGLGRGLSALIPKKIPPKVGTKTGRSLGMAQESKKSSIGDDSAVVLGMQVVELDVQLIDPNKYQPRRYFREEELESLAASIREHGVLQPITVTKSSNGRYELIAGERRLQASKRADKALIPAIIRDSMEDQERLELALIENIQRDDLNAIEEALAYQQLIDEFQLTQDMVAQRAGKSRSTVANFLRLLDLPVEVQKGLIAGTISEGHARIIRSVKNLEQQVALFQDIVNYNLTVRQTEERLKRLREPRKSVRERLKEEARPDPDLRALQTRLADLLQTDVAIEYSRDGGNLKIMFGDKRDLNSILDRMSRFQ